MTLASEALMGIHDELIASLIINSQGPESWHIEPDPNAPCWETVASYKSSGDTGECEVTLREMSKDGRVLTELSFYDGDEGCIYLDCDQITQLRDFLNEHIK